MKISAITNNYKALLEDIGHKPTLVENEDKACSCGMGLSWRDELGTGKCRYCKEWGPDWRKQMARLDAKAQKQYENKYKYGKPDDEPVTEDVELDIPEPIMNQDLQKGQCCKCGDKAIKLNDVHPGDGFTWEFAKGKELCKRCYDKAQMPDDEPEEFQLSNHPKCPDCNTAIRPCDYGVYQSWGKCRICKENDIMTANDS